MQLAPREKCAVFGAIGSDFDAARITFFGLYALQHRGQEGSGIVSSEGEHLHAYRASGLVNQIYTEPVMKKLPGTLAIGHNRYSTSKGGDTEHRQPVIGQDKLVAVAHNGNLPSTKALEVFLKKHGVSARNMSDSELMAAAIRYYMVQGKSVSMAVKLAEPDQKLDVFEFVYFARPDSYLLGKSVDAVRQSMGKQLAAETSIQADIVVPVPDSGIPAAQGFSEATGIPLSLSLIKNRYIGRTFIQPEQHLREWMVRMKLNPIRSAIAGKRVVIVDDSIVRGTTSPQVIQMLRDAGATEIHFLVSSPPYRYPDFYGIDTPAQEQLIAFAKPLEEIHQFLGVDSLHYLSYEGLIAATGLPESQLCTSCFTGEYPVSIEERMLEIRCTPRERKQL
ncbi:hypothetical protein BH11PAT4_BH11PAT4_3610 [soil metagenome]